MLNRRMLLVGGLGVMLGALPIQSLSGQTASSWSGRPWVEGFYTQIRFDSDGSTLNANGIGGRLMWSPASTVEGTSSLVSRTDLGFYGTYTPERRFAQDYRFSSVGVGGVADVRPFAAPLAGRVDPFLSLGAGVLHSYVDRGTGPAPSPLLRDSWTSFALTPGIGARVPLTTNVALQGDVRDIITFRNDTRHNVAFGVGLRLTF